MTIYVPKDHRQPSYFVFGKWWDIKSQASFDNLIELLSHETQRDKKGRILCSGRPRYDMPLQKRLFVVKMGHDGVLWSNTYPLGQTFKSLLQGKQ